LKKLTRLITIFAVLAFIPAKAHANETKTIIMKSISYDPKRVSIKVGDKLEWKNKSYTEHSATAEKGSNSELSFDTGMIAPNKTSKPVEFKVPGVFEYHCTMHGKTMSGEITVNAE
jgi:plastocyanin